MSTTSPNMGLVIPTIAVDSGLQWETGIDSSLTIIDGHNHTSGQGVQIPPAGLNISSNLTFQGNAATNLMAAVFAPQTSLATLDALYVKGVDLYYNDGSGNVIRMTTGGTVNATSSGIASGTATAGFSSGVLVVDSNTNTPANIQGGSILLGNNVANSKYLTLSPPNSMAANYSLVLPSIPASLSFMTIDTSGNMGTSSGVSAAQITSGSIVGSQLANQTITATQIANNTITRTQEAAVGQQISSSCGSFATTSGTFAPVTNLSVTITTSGRPVMLFVQAAAGNQGILDINTVGGTEIVAADAFYKGGVQLMSRSLIQSIAGAGGAIDFRIGGPVYMDTPAAGTYTYAYYVQAGTNSTVTCINLVLVAYEL